MPLADLRSHKQQLLAGMGQQVRVKAPGAEEIKEKVNESRSRQEEEDEEQDEKEKSGQYAPKCTLREPVL